MGNGLFHEILLRKIMSIIAKRVARKKNTKEMNRKPDTCTKTDENKICSEIIQSQSCNKLLQTNTDAETDANIQKQQIQQKATRLG